MIDIKGAFDIHVHSAPSIFERPFTAFQVAEMARSQGMAGLVLKHHFEPSVSRAIMVQQAYPELIIVGGVVLNRYVGGLNPYAAEAAIKQGGRVVWFPTIDAKNHFDYFGRTSGYDETNAGDGGPRLVGGATGFERLTRGPGITVFDEAGELKDAAREIVEICRDHDVLLNTAHIGPKEAHAVLEFARSIGHKRVMVGHAQWKPMGLSTSDIVELADMGAMIEFAASISLPIPGHTRPREVVDCIEQVGVERCVLSSDAGAAVYPIAPEALRSWLQCLLDVGLAEDDARRMMSDNPRELVGV